MTKKYLYISSKDRKNGSVGNFVCELNKAFDNMKCIRLKNAIIPNSWFEINENYNKLYFSVSSVEYIATIPKQIYLTEAAFCTAIKTAMNAIYLTDNLFDCTFNINTKQITISHSSTNFNILLSKSTIKYFLGFDESQNLTGNNTYTGNNWLILNQNLNLTFCMDIVKSEHIHTDARGCIYTNIPVNQPVGSYIIYENQNQEFQQLKDESLKRFQIYFLDKHKNFIDFNNVDMELTFELI